MPEDFGSGPEDFDYDNAYSNDHATFGDRLAAARDALHLSQEELAKRIGVRLSTIQNWEDDRSEPRSNRLQIMSGVLNVSLVWLLTGEGAAPEEILADDGDSVHVSEALAELAAIRQDQRRLAERAGRLEKRLRALLIR